MRWAAGKKLSQVLRRQARVMAGLNQAIKIVAVGEIRLVGDGEVDVAIVRLPAEGIDPGAFAAISTRVFGMVKTGEIGSGHFPQDAGDGLACRWLAVGDSAEPVGAAAIEHQP